MKIASIADFWKFGESLFQKDPNAFLEAYLPEDPKYAECLREIGSQSALNVVTPSQLDALLRPSSESVTLFNDVPCFFTEPDLQQTAGTAPTVVYDAEGKARYCTRLTPTIWTAIRKAYLDLAREGPVVSVDIGAGDASGLMAQIFYNPGAKAFAFDRNSYQLRRAEGTNKVFRRVKDSIGIATDQRLTYVVGDILANTGKIVIALTDLLRQKCYAAHTKIIYFHFVLEHLTAESSALKIGHQNQEREPLKDGWWYLLNLLRNHWLKDETDKVVLSIFCTVTQTPRAKLLPEAAAGTNIFSHTAVEELQGLLQQMEFQLEEIDDHNNHGIFWGVTATREFTTDVAKQQFLAKQANLTLGTCTYCGLRTYSIKQCSRCGTPYCRKACQKVHWKKSHKDICKPSAQPAAATAAASADS